MSKRNMSKDILVQKIFVQKKLSKKNFGEIFVQKNFSCQNYFLVRNIFVQKNPVKKNLVQTNYNPQNCWLDTEIILVS